MKDKKVIILIIVIIGLLIAIVYVKSNQQKAINWQPTFYNTDTNPYGTYINYELLKDIFSNNKIRSTRLPIYNNLKESVESHFQYYNNSDNQNEYTYSDDYNSEDDLEDNIEDIDSTNIQILSIEDDINRLYTNTDIADTTTYIFINNEFKVDEIDLEYLLDFAGLGNNVFIAAEQFSDMLMDTLQIEDKKTFYGSDTIYNLIDYPQKKYPFSHIYNQTSFDTEKCVLPIRILARKNNNDAVFIQIKYGKGNIYLHSVPVAFTNINMLNTESYDFAFRCFSYIPKNNSIIWDEYQKQGAPGERSIFRGIYSSKPLTIAFIITLIGFLLFMIFRAKRTQRIIPIIRPPINSSIEFLDTISNLYYRKKDFRTIVSKRHAYFLDYIRRNYYLSTENINPEFIKSLSLKSNVDIETLNSLFDLYKDISTLYYILNDQFLKYNSLLENFYKNSKNK